MRAWPPTAPGPQVECAARAGGREAPMTCGGTDDCSLRADVLIAPRTRPKVRSRIEDVR